jgi:hypothetical protein
MMKVYGLVMRAEQKVKDGAGMEVINGIPAAQPIKRVRLIAFPYLRPCNSR